MPYTIIIFQMVLLLIFTILMIVVMLVSMLVFIFVLFILVMALIFIMPVVVTVARISIPEREAAVPWIVAIIPMIIIMFHKASVSPFFLPVTLLIVVAMGVIIMPLAMFYLCESRIGRIHGQCFGSVRLKGTGCGT